MAYTKAFALLKVTTNLRKLWKLPRNFVDSSSFLPGDHHPASNGKYNQTIYWRQAEAGGELGVFSISGMLQTSISEYLTYSGWLLLRPRQYLCAIFMRAQVTVSRELQLPPALIRSLWMGLWIARSVNFISWKFSHTHCIASGGDGDISAAPSCTEAYFVKQI